MCTLRRHWVRTMGVRSATSAKRPVNFGRDRRVARVAKRQFYSGRTAFGWNDRCYVERILTHDSKKVVESCYYGTVIGRNLPTIYVDTFMLILSKVIRELHFVIEKLRFLVRSNFLDTIGNQD
jgi:hypothetical protein